MKRLQMLAVAALLAASATSASAQNQQGQRRGGGDPSSMLLQGITLTAAQQAKIDSLGRQMMAEMAAMRADTTVEVEARRAKGREMRTRQVEAIKAILNEEQRKVLEKNVADMQARMQQGGGQRPPRR